MYTPGGDSKCRTKKREKTKRVDTKILRKINSFYKS